MNAASTTTDRLSAAAEIVRIQREAYERTPWWRPIAKYRAWRSYEDVRFVVLQGL